MAVPPARTDASRSRPTAMENDRPDGLPGRSIVPIQCVCGAVNAAERRFCGNCGVLLWEPCCSCGEMAGVGEKFCGFCGADLAEERRRRAEQVRLDLDKADQLGTERRYQEAIDLLTPIAEISHPRFAEFARRAMASVQRFVAERDRYLAEIEPLLEDARERLANGDRAGAVWLLQKIPPPFRTPEAEIVLAEAAADMSEVSTLAAELRSADGRFPLDLLDKLGRLLELQADHPQATEMAWRICRRVFEAAQAAIAECKYPKATKLLERIPVAARTPEAEAMRKRVMEIQFLFDALRTAQWIDKPLLAIALRLRELAPHDRELAAVCVQLAHCAQDSAAAAATGDPLGLTAYRRAAWVPR